MSVLLQTLLLTLALCLGWGRGIASITTRTNADGIRVRYAYDALGRVTNQRTLTTGGGSNHVAALGYGPSGLLTSRLDASGTHQWVHDILGRLRTNVTPAGTLHYTYNAAGNPLTLANTTANGCNDRLDNDGVTNTVSAHFDAKGNTVNYAAVTYGYDWDNRLTSSSAGGGSAVYNLGG